MAGVAVSNVTRAFGSVRALDDVSIAFDDGGFYALLGPSGSGKTTLLRMIAGFDYPDSGTISIGKVNVEHVPVERREIGMVFQNYALFPNMSVFDNVAFGLSVRSVAKREIGARVAEALRLVQLEGYEARRPHQLSGGQRQRVALARAIVTRPRVLLLDEPLSALDKTLRVEMQLELRRIQREIGITTIFVTHDQEEALTMSDRIGILRDGRLVQEGRPEELYHRPASVFSATFLGEANILRGTGAANGLRLADGGLVVAEESHIFEDGAVACAIRPERISIAPMGDRPAAQNSLSAKLVGSVFAGANIIYLTEWNGQPIKVVARNDGTAPIEPDTIVELSWTSGAVAPVKDC